MDEKTASMIKETLDKLAEQLGTTGAQMWEVLIKQAMVSFWSEIVWIAVGTTIVAIFAIAFIVGVKRKWDKEIVGSILALGGIVMLIHLAIVACSIKSMLTCYFNPEYYALNKVLSMLN